MTEPGNFHFLSHHDARLVAFGAAAERYLHEDPNTSIFKLRQFAELLCKTVAARQALYLGERESFEETLELCGILGDEAIRRRGFPALG